MKKQIRFFFVSDYLTPLVIAIQQYQEKIEKVVAIASESKKGKANTLKKLIHSERSDMVEVIKLKKDGKDEFHSIISEVQPRIASWAEKNSDKELVFDLTGGTKIMALVLYEIARDLQSKGYSTKISYTNTDANAFQWIGETPAEDKMTVRLNIQQLLEASGHEVEEIRCNRKKIPPRMVARRSITEELMAKTDKDIIGKLNGWANEARNGARESQRPIEIGYKDNLSATIPVGFLNRLQDVGALSYKKIGNSISSITFTDGEWASYLSGDWLEEWAWWQVYDIPELDGCSMGVTIKNKETKNELDLVLCCRNRLLVIEAKTAALSGSQKRASKEADVMYKISDIVGKLSHSSYGTKLLLSWQSLSEPALKRARDGSLFVLANPGSKNSEISRDTPEKLREVVQEWVEIGRLKRQA